MRASTRSLHSTSQSRSDLVGHVLVYTKIHIFNNLSFLLITYSVGCARGVDGNHRSSYLLPS